MDLITTAVAVYPVPETAVVYPTTAWMGTERGIAAPVPLVQYDNTLPILAVALRLNGQPYTLPEGAAVNVRMDKRDGHYVYNPALGVSEDRQKAYIAVTLQMTTGAGEYWPTIEIVIDGHVAGTSYVPLLIAENPIPEDAIESTDEYKTIQQLAAEVTQAAQIVQDNAEGIQYVQENAANITAVAQNRENISAVGESIANVNTVAENLTPIQTAATNIAAIQKAPQQAANAAASATLSESWAVGGTGTREGENTNNAKYWAEQAQSIAQGGLGWYETEQALQAAHPTGQNGQWAIIGTTDTIWTWDSDTSAWVDSGAQVDLSDYYTKHQADAAFATAAQGQLAQTAMQSIFAAGIGPVVNKEIQQIDLLEVNVHDYDGPQNSPFFFGSNTPSTDLANSPYSTGPFYGYRQTFFSRFPSNNSPHLITVVIFETYPMAGRIWGNTYDTTQSNWIGWHGTSMA